MALAAYRTPAPYIPTFTRQMPQERKRLVADRFRRIWAIVEEIAANPGRSRRQLSDKFHLSERQVQADLNIIRSEMRLPLVRRHGYRFVSEGQMGSRQGLTTRDVQLMVLALCQVQRSQRGKARDALTSVLAKLPNIVPPHLFPLAAKLLEVSGSTGQEARTVMMLADALVAGSPVRLHFYKGADPGPIDEPVVTPEQLIPYLDDWYVLGPCEQQRTGYARMYAVSALMAVTSVIGDKA